MSMKMNSFSASLQKLRGRINAPVVASVGLAFAAGIGSSLLLTGSDASSGPQGAPTAVAATTDPCVTQAWPYRDQACRDAETAARKMRDVRIVSTDGTQPARVVKSVAPEPPAPASSQPAPSTPSTNVAAADAPPVRPQGPAPTWLMSVDQVPADKTITPPVPSLALATAKVPTPEAAQPAEATPPSPAAAAEPATTASVPATEPPPAALDKPRQLRTAVAKPARRYARDARTVTPRQDEAGAPRMLIRTYEFADGRQVTVRHRLTAGEGRPDLDADGVLSNVAARNIRVLREVDDDED